MVYQAFIEEQLKAEWARRSRLDQLGARLQQFALVAAGVVVSAFSVIVGVRGSLPQVPLGLAIMTLLLFLVAAVLAMVVQSPYKYTTAEVTTLERMVNSRWGDTAVDSRNQVANLSVETIKAMRPGNGAKALWALGTQVLLTIGAFTGVATLIVTAILP